MAAPRHDGDVPPPRHVIVLAGGDPVVPPLPYALPEANLVIAADSGLAVATVLDLDVDVVVGDLDSVDPAALDAARAAGATIDRHSPCKDRTDLAIAMDTALAAGAETITVIGGAGGRLDHLLAMPLLIASSDYAEIQITAVTAGSVVTVVRGHRLLAGEPGELVGLLAVHGDAVGVSTRGLRFPLDGEVLRAGSSRGVSNVFESIAAEVDVRQGVVIAVQPGVAASATATPDALPGAQ